MSYGQTKFNPQSKICLMCGSANIHNYSAYAADSPNKSMVSITECNKCNFAWQFPFARSEKQSMQYFVSAYNNAGKTNSDYFNPERKRKIAKLEFDFMDRLPVENKRILDIGAGAGLFAEVASENGWQVTAIDPAMDMERYSSNENITAIRGTFDEVLDQDLFNVVTLWDVIEHTTNPIEVIDKARQYIKDNGWLIIETGNFKSAERVADGLNHWIYQLDHRWYFSPVSIVALLKDAGFSEFTFSERVLRPEWQGNVAYHGPSMRNLVKSLIRHPMQFQRHVSTYIALKKAMLWEMSGIVIFAVAARKV